MEDLDINNLVEGKIKDCKEQCDVTTKLGKDDFWKILGVLMAVLVAVIGVQWSKINTLEKVVNDHQLVSVRIETQLAQIQTDLLDIKASLTKK